MAVSDSAAAFWIDFLKTAGIPGSDVHQYAMIFTDNRVTRSMLQDLNKEHLNDMGIRLMGDVIAILKHAKIVHQQDSAALKTSRAVSIQKPVQCSHVTPMETSRTGSLTKECSFNDIKSSDTIYTEKKADLSISTLKSKKPLPPSRIVEHYLIGNELLTNPEPSLDLYESSTPKVSEALSQRLGPTPVKQEESGFRSDAVLASKAAQNTDIQSESQGILVLKQRPKPRRVLPEHEGKYKIIMPKGTTTKTKRLLAMQKGKSSVTKEYDNKIQVSQSTANSKETSTPYGNHKIKSSTATVFERLGNVRKRPEPDDCQLAYAGVIKKQKSSEKFMSPEVEITMTTSGAFHRIPSNSIAKEHTQSSQGSHGIFQVTSPTLGVFRRLGRKVDI